MISKIYSFFFEKPYFSTETRSDSWKKAATERIHEADVGNSYEDRYKRFFAMQDAELIIHQLLNEYHDKYGSDAIMDKVLNNDSFKRFSDVDISGYGFRNFIRDSLIPIVQEQEGISRHEATKRVREDLGQAYMNLIENVRSDMNMEEMEERAPRVTPNIVDDLKENFRSAQETGFTCEERAKEIARIVNNDPDTDFTDLTAADFVNTSQEDGE